MENYTKTEDWRNKIRALPNDELLNMYKQTNPDSMKSTEYIALIFLRGEVLKRMQQPLN